MHNKYIYLFFKDGVFRSVFIFSICGIILCFFLTRMDIWQSLKLKDIHDKQAMITQIPAFEARLAQLGKKTVNGFFLSGIASDQEQQMAVINNVLIKIGEEVDGKKLVKITDQGVTLCDVGAAEKCIQLILQN